MYGMPADLDLTMFHGTNLIQICLGVFQLQFWFHGEDQSVPQPYLAVEGYWELRDADGGMVDQGGNAERDDGQPVIREVLSIHALLGQKVIASELAPPTSFTLVFGDGARLSVFDNAERYESVSIQPGDVII
jgi:hypothetical protein